MSANMPSLRNALMRPTEGPSRFTGSPGGDVIPAGTPRMPANALQMPQQPVAAPVMPPVAPVPVAPAAPVPATSEMQPGIQDHISPRVPVPKGDFPEAQHNELHETMGPAFDQPFAAAWVNNMYDRVRQMYPHIDPRHALEVTRDAYHAVNHGFADHYTAGLMVNHHVRARHAADEARRTKRDNSG